MTPKERRRVLEEWARARLAALDETYGAKAALARRAGTSRAHISNMVSGKSGIGDEMLDRLAEVWGFASRADMEVTALRETGGVVPAAPVRGPASRTYEREARYDTLLALVRRWRVESRYPHDLLDDLLHRTAHFSPTDLSEESWTLIADGLLARLRGKAVDVVESPEHDDEAEELARRQRELGTRKTTKRGAK